MMMGQGWRTRRERGYFCFERLLLLLFQVIQLSIYNASRFVLEMDYLVLLRKKIGWDLHSCLFNGLNECVCTTRLAGWLAQEE